MLDLKKNKILITGGSGFLGTHLTAYFKQKGIKSENIIAPNSKDFDLRNFNSCLKITNQIDLVIHLAANVGGIYHHTLFPGKLFYDNILMGINIIEASRINKIKKFVCIGTACSYPETTKIPFKEVSFWKGYPEKNNAPYAIAKKALQVMLSAYREEYGFNGIYLVLANMYGELDNFDKENAHVIPSLIKRAYEAKINNSPVLEVWGKPTVTRDFLYVKDAVRGIELACQKINHSQPINLTSGKQHQIKEIVQIITDLVKFRGKVVYKKDMPIGQIHRTLSPEKAIKEMGFRAKISLQQGLKNTIKWYINNQ